MVAVPGGGAASDGRHRPRAVQMDKGLKIKVSNHENKLMLTVFSGKCGFLLSQDLSALGPFI